MYVLDERLQNQGGSIPKWNKRANLGIYMGTSPRHSRKVALVLNIETGHVSPQFHVKIDDFFETLRPSAGNIIPKSKWQRITGLKSTRTLNQNRTKGTDTNIPPSENVFWMDVADKDNEPIASIDNSITGSDAVEDIIDQEQNDMSAEAMTGIENVEGLGVSIPDENAKIPSTDQQVNCKNDRKYSTAT